MNNSKLFNLDHSYLSLPDKFHTLVKPSPLVEPTVFSFNKALSAEIDVTIDNDHELIKAISDEEALQGIDSFAQAYAGHQFGHFTKLGDGRAIMLGEHLTKQNKRFDIQLKGGGRTVYSRGGDGKATLKAMLREYLISEAIHHLNIPTSRSLAVIETGDSVYREKIEKGAVLIRVMKSHIRVGTFEFPAYLGGLEDLEALANYTIHRLYPEIENDKNPALSLLDKVISAQIDLVVNWMRVGFIHGVMNTDNTSISGEAFDYGPCAFMNAYDPATVYSSIDRNSRYCFGNQPKIIKWNLSRFAETLLPLLHEDKDKAVSIAQSTIDGFDDIWKDRYNGMMLNKIGIDANDSNLYSMVDELLEIMRENNMDYTNTFWALSQDKPLQELKVSSAKLESWLSQWKQTLEELGSVDVAKHLMAKNNPVYIPRNHFVEQVLEEAVSGDTSSFNRLLSVISDPYSYQSKFDAYMMPPEDEFEQCYQTFCGT